MHVLIVYAHPEPASFNGALLDVARQTLAGSGHEVTVSDLYAQRFDPAGGPADFAKLADPTFFSYQREQLAAVGQGTFTPDVREEMEKLRRADALILQFPLWWFSLPAVLKGWVDRVFAFGFAYGGAHGSYRKGPFTDKKAMLSLTTGGPELAYGEGARNGDLNKILFPIHHGMLYFTGMQVLPPFVAWGPARADAATRQQYLDVYAHRLRGLERTPPLAF